MSKNMFYGILVGIFLTTLAALSFPVKSAEVGEQYYVLGGCKTEEGARQILEHLKVGDAAGLNRNPVVLSSCRPMGNRVLATVGELLFGATDPEGDEIIVFHPVEAPHEWALAWVMNKKKPIGREAS